MFAARPPGEERDRFDTVAATKSHVLRLEERAELGALGLGDKGHVGRFGHLAPLFRSLPPL